MDTKDIQTSQGSTPVDISLALAPNNIDAVPRLLEEITAGVQALKTGGEITRHELAIKARDMMLALETPRETMIKHVWAQGGALGGFNYGVDSGLWTLMAKNGDRPQKVSELAETLGLNQRVLSRLLRHLSAMGYIEDAGVDEYKPTNFIKSLSIPIIGDGYLAMTSCTTHGQLKLHEFSRERGWSKEPTNSKDTALMYAYNMDKDMFSWQQSLGYGPHFNHHMSGYRQGRPPWCGPNFFPVQEKLVDGFKQDPDEVMLVDIGGSLGHDMVQFQKLNPNHPGKLILQDLPIVIGQLEDLDQSVTAMAYDFLGEQPVKGARAYYMHSVLHDWPDDVCTNILNRIAEAMEPGYSKILINENVIPTRNAYWETTALDMVMLAGFSAKERTEADWYHLIEKLARLKIIKIWEGGQGVESLIEVQLA